MRSAKLLLSLTVALLTGSALASGCVDSASSPNGVDASFDAASLPGFDAHGSDTSAPPPGSDASASGSFDTTPIDFGLVNCGAGGAPKTYTFTNTGPVPITYSAAIENGAVFAVQGTSSGTVAPGASASLAVAVANVPTTSKAGTAVAGALTVTTDVPGFTQVRVPLSVTPQGGSLAVSPALAGFGQVQIGLDGTPIPLTITNVGNLAVNVTLATATDAEFGVTYTGAPAPGAIAPGGGVLSGASATFHPTSGGALKTATAAIQTTDPLCASAASAVSLSGTGTAAQITVGPDPLQFGTVSCGAKGAALQVTIKNTSAGGVTFTDALGRGAASPFQVDVASGTVPGNGQTVITVTPKAIPVPGNIAVGAYDDTLVVTPAASSGVGPTTLTLKESAQGAILVFAMPTSAFGTVQNTTATLPFTVTNNGNVSAPLTLSTTGTGYGATFTGTSTAASGGGQAIGTASFTSTSNATVGGSVKVSTTQAMCAAPPGVVSLTATGAVPVATFPTGTIALAATCGNGATSQATLLVQNTGNAPLTLVGVKSVNGTFTVTSAPASIPAQSQGSIVVQAAAIGTGIAGGSSRADSLAFTTNEVGNPTRTVPVSVAVSGANLSFVGGNQVAVTSCALTPYTVTNTGNMPANVTGDPPYPSDASNNFYFGNLAFSQSVVLNAGTSVQDGVGYGAVCQNQTSPCSLTGTAKFTVLNAAGSTVGICIPLPVLNLTLNFPGVCSGCC